MPNNPPPNPPVDDRERELLVEMARNLITMLDADAPLSSHETKMMLYDLANGVIRLARE